MCLLEKRYNDHVNIILIQATTGNFRHNKEKETSGTKTFGSHLEIIKDKRHGVYGK